MSHLTAGQTGTNIPRSYYRFGQKGEHGMIVGLKVIGKPLFNGGFFSPLMPRPVLFYAAREPRDEKHRNGKLANQVGQKSQNPTKCRTNSLQGNRGLPECQTYFFLIEVKEGKKINFYQAVGQALGPSL